MRIVVLSDAHGFVAPVETAIEKSKPDVVIFCGDGASRVEDISYLYPEIKFYIVKGNCDASNFPYELEEKIGSKRFFITHGHNYNVKYSYDEIINSAKIRGVDVVLFGHTHIPVNEYNNGLYIMNPGSCAMPRDRKPTYGFIDVVGNNIVTNIVEL